MDSKWYKSSHSMSTGCVEVTQLPETMLRPVTFDDEPDDRIQVAKMIPYEESEEDSW